jgi:Domain of unknown function (DUF4337)
MNWRKKIQNALQLVNAATPGILSATRYTADVHLPIRMPEEIEIDTDKLRETIDA